MYAPVSRTVSFRFIILLICFGCFLFLALKVFFTISFDTNPLDPRTLAAAAWYPKSSVTQKPISFHTNPLASRTLALATWYTESSVIQKSISFDPNTLALYHSFQKRARFWALGNFADRCVLGKTNKMKWIKLGCGGWLFFQGNRKKKNHMNELSQTYHGRGWGNVRVRSSHVTGRGSTNMGWVWFTCYYGPVLKIEAHALGVGGGPCSIKPKSFDEDPVKTRK